VQVFKGPPLSSYKVPDYKYFPTNLMESEGPKHWAQLRFLQACERLNIPRDQWPSFPKMRLPHAYGLAFVPNGIMRLRSINPMYETEAEWRASCREDLERFLDEEAQGFRAWFQRELDTHRLAKIKPSRGSTPLNLRYEWAAQRHCSGLQYKEMAPDKYSDEVVRKTVTRILEVVGLRHRK
jgi:hypothetical protein